MNEAYNYCAGWISSSEPNSGRGSPAALRTVLVYAMMVGTGGLMSADYIAKRAEHGYAYYQITNAPAQASTMQRTPAENLARIREVLKPAVSDLAMFFGVSRQAIYAWQGGAEPTPKSAARLSDLAGAADVIAAEGVASTPRLLQRRIAGAKTLLTVAQEGGSATDAAHALAKMVQRELEQRRELDKRLAARKRQPADYSAAGTPMIDDTT